MINHLDGFGIYGLILHYSAVCTIVGGTFIVFIYLWAKGLLNMDEEAKNQMMKSNDEAPHGKN